MKYKLGFIGCGNMGSALVKAASKSLSQGEIAVFDKHPEKVNDMVSSFGAVAVTPEALIESSQFVVLGVKPQAMESTLSTLAPLLQAQKDVTVVTMAAGVSMLAIQQYIGKKVPVIRIMPNTPVTLGEGMILYTSTDVSKEKISSFTSYFAKAGIFDYVTEEELDMGGALSGSGPAFVYLFTEALIEGGKALGLSPSQAELYAMQTVKGAAEMMLAYKKPADLRKAVCSPNGTTLKGIAAMEDAGFSSCVNAAIQAAYQRTLELKK